MRNVIWILVAVVILLGGYMLFTGQSVDELTQGAAEEAAEAETDTTIEQEAEETVAEAEGE